MARAGRGRPGSYWVYQHLGNLGAQDRAEDEIWRRIADHAGDDELDLTAALDDLADRVDQEPTTYRWSYARDFDDQARLVVVDSRAARVLDPTAARCSTTTRWPGSTSGCAATSTTSWSGRRCRSCWPRGCTTSRRSARRWPRGVGGGWAAGRRAGLRQHADLEHWAAFQGGFVQVAQMVVDVARRGGAGRTPRSITFMSGDVHHSYVAEAWADPAARATLDSRGRAGDLLADPQPAARAMRFVDAVLSYGWSPAAAGPLVARTGKGADPPVPLAAGDRGPWFDNNLATLQVRGQGLVIRWDSGAVRTRATTESPSFARWPGSSSSRTTQLAAGPPSRSPSDPRRNPAGPPRSRQPPGSSSGRTAVPRPVDGPYTA